MIKIFYLLLISTIISGLSSLETTQGNNLNNAAGTKTSFAETNAKAAGKTINLGYSGFVGVLFMIVFFLILIVFFNLILQTGDFNYKFIKEKMPLGKEY